MPISSSRASTALLALVLVALLGALGPATRAAAGTPAAVAVRVQGQSATLLPYTPVTTTNTPPPTDSTATGTSAAGALELATHGNWDRKCFTDTILGETHSFTHNDYWAFWLGHGGSYVYSQSGICATELAPGDEVLMVADVFTSTPTVYPLSLSGVPASVQRGAPFTVTATEYRSDGSHTTATAAAGVVVSAGTTSTTTGPSGQATLSVTQTGTYAVTAAKSSRVPSVPVQVCVHDGNDGRCGTGGPGSPAAGSPGAPAPGQSAGGNSADGRPALPSSPIGRILGVRDGHYFHRIGPRELKASVLPDAAGLASVRLRLERRRGRLCEGYDGRSERFRRIRCGARHAPWFGVGAGPEVSYLLPFALPRGRYVLDLEAIARDGRRDDTLARGRNRILFWVG